MLKYDRSIIAECLEAMNPENCYIFLSSKSFGDKYDFKEEKWMGGKYHVQDLEEERLTQWKNVQLNDELFVPDSNKYLAENTSLKVDEPRLDQLNYLHFRQFFAISFIRYKNLRL